ncbi:hypothetical protein PY310_07345 [Pseudarthrobacter sp. H3Y2-7]|nr:hypothetical protein [Pseudarthrobacter sp. H3Y2-7]MDE8668397.1 hypothetical protein [Pseudarthrobacter sp. H3Y2-7]
MRGEVREQAAGNCLGHDDPFAGTEQVSLRFVKYDQLNDQISFQ